MSQNYKDTLNLPRTDFPMKANLAAREPEMLRAWEYTKLYQQIDATVAKKMVPWVYLFDFKNIYGVSDRLVWKATPYVFMDLRGAKLS